MGAALFYTWMHCAAVHIRVLRGLDVYVSKEIILGHSEVIRLLNEEMQDLVRACTDGNILAVSGMASYGWDESSCRTMKSPSQGPLKSLQGLNAYSMMKSVPSHTEGLAKLVEMRGGLQNIEMEGLAATLS